VIHTAPNDNCWFSSSVFSVRGLTLSD
jgi:hypothetical protein